MANLSSLMRFFLAALSTRLVAAAYTNLYFNTSNGCPDLVFGCYAPESMCAYDSVNDKYYCCSGADYDVCRAFAVTCTGSGGGAGNSQQQCGDDSDGTWCCLSEGTETCSDRKGQVNVCRASQDNPIGAVPQILINQTFSSLSSANPSATSLSVDFSSLAARATASSTSSSSVASTSSTTSASQTATQTPEPDSDSISGGAVAGIVVGCVGGLALVGALVWFLLRRRRNQRISGVQPTSPTGAPDEKRGHFGSPSPGIHTPAPQYQLAEMESGREISEVSGDAHKGLLRDYEPSELPSGRMEPRELPG